MIRLSVVIPAYNCAQWLKRAVLSTQKLGISPVDVLIVDDGSTDETSIICQELVEDIPDVRYLYQRNGGLSSARNFGIAQAIGRYILLLDADDELLGCDLATVLSSGADMVRVGVEEVLNNLPVHIHRDDAFIGNGVEYLRQRFSNQSFYTPSWAYLYRREWLLESNLAFLPGLLHEDNLFTVQALIAAKLVVASPAVVYRYIRREGSITTDRSELKLRRRISSLSNIVAELTQLANQHKQLDLRWWIDQVVHNAATLAVDCQGPGQRLRVISLQARYMVAYRGYGALGLGYWQRRRLMALIFGYRRKRVEHA